MLLQAFLVSSEVDTKYDLCVSWYTYIICILIVGLECYIRLNLADHCQESYNDGQEASEFGFYHFREVQRDCSGYPSLPHPPPPFLQGRKSMFAGCFLC